VTGGLPAEDAPPPGPRISGLRPFFLNPYSPECVEPSCNPPVLGYT
jgi:hypothetical protein